MDWLQSYGIGSISDPKKNSGKIKKIPNTKKTTDSKKNLRKHDTKLDSNVKKENKKTKEIKSRELRSKSISSSSDVKSKTVRRTSAKKEIKKAAEKRYAISGNRVLMAKKNEETGSYYVQRKDSRGNQRKIRVKNTYTSKEDAQEVNRPKRRTSRKRR